MLVAWNDGPNLARWSNKIRSCIWAPQNNYKSTGWNFSLEVFLSFWESLENNTGKNKQKTNVTVNCANQSHAPLNHDGDTFWDLRHRWLITERTPRRASRHTTCCCCAEHPVPLALWSRLLLLGDKPDIRSPHKTSRDSIEHRRKWCYQETQSTRHGWGSYWHSTDYCYTTNSLYIQKSTL